MVVTLTRNPLWLIPEFLQRFPGVMKEFGALPRTHCFLPTGDSFELRGLGGEPLLQQPLLARQQRAAIDSAA